MKHASSVLALAALVLATTAQAQEAWHDLSLPAATPEADIHVNPMQGFYGWHEGGVVPMPHRSTEGYGRFTWADLEPREGVYDFSQIDAALSALGPRDRLAFGIFGVDTCCSAHNGRDMPAYLIASLTKGFWIDADPGNYGHVKKVYVPDWNDPVFLERWQKLMQALGARYNGDPRIAWVDIRGYGNWGEGHLAGANAYHWTQFPYDDPKVNVHGAAPGTLESRIAMADAVIDAFPDTQLLAMTDDKPVLVHALKRSPRIGMRRDSWGAKMFGDSLLGDISSDDRDLVLNRWKTAPFIVESYGWEKVFEAGLDGIVKQVEDYHISAIGNGNFNVRQWSDLSTGQQSALLRSGNRAGYRYVPVSAQYRTSADTACPLEVRMTWRNDGVAPAYDAWQVSLSAGKNAAAFPPLPKILPGDAITQQACLKISGEDAPLRLQVAEPVSGRTMILPLAGGDAENGYALSIPR